VPAVSTDDRDSSEISIDPNGPSFPRWGFLEEP
jgi:hypothetical protein